MSSQSTVLLLTATIDPGQTLMVARRDPLIRLNDYRQALAAWVACDATPKIVLCENSGYDLDALRTIGKGFRGEIEFVSFAGNETGASKGKGHAELEMIKHVLRHSRLIHTAQVIVKCTGRLTVRNGPQLFAALAAYEFDVMCTLKQNLSFADSRLFAARPSFITNYLAPRDKLIDDTAGVTFEHALASAVGSAIGDLKRWLPFPIFPVIEGISGTDGKSMTNSCLKRVNKGLYHRLRNLTYRN